MAVYRYSGYDQEDEQLKLLPLICKMNDLSFNHFHRSWFETTKEWQEIELVLGSGVGYKHISTFMKKRYRLKSKWITDFTDPKYKILLMDTGVLNRVVFYMGLIIVSPHIKKIINGGTVRKITEVIGEDAFSFARKKAAFYNPKQLSRLIKADPDAINPEDISREIMKRGVMCMAIAFWEEEKYVKTRLAIKLPKPMAKLMLNESLQRAPKELLNRYQEVVYNTFLKMVSEVAPEWKTILLN